MDDLNLDNSPEGRQLADACDLALDVPDPYGYEDHGTWGMYNAEPMIGGEG